MLKFLKSPIFAVFVVAFAAALFVVTGVVGCQRDVVESQSAGTSSQASSEFSVTEPAKPLARPAIEATHDPAPETTDMEPIVRPSREVVELPSPKLPARQRSQVADLDIADPELPVEPTVVPADEEEEAPAQLTVLSGRLAKDVVKRAPVDASDRFVADGSSVWAWVKVRNPGAETHIWMNWRLGDKVYSRVRLRVGKSRGWRTWSRHRMRTDKSAGKWFVDVRTDDGELLDTMGFEVMSTVASAAQVGDSSASIADIEDSDPPEVN